MEPILGAAARDRPALGGDLPLPHGAPRAQIAAPGRPIPGGQPGPRLSRRRAGRIPDAARSATATATICLRNAQRPAPSLDDLIESAGRPDASGAANPQPSRIPGLGQLSSAHLTSPPTTITLLASALKEAGKDPQVVLCPWNDYVEQTEAIYDQRAGLPAHPRAPAGLPPVRPAGRARFDRADRRRLLRFPDRRYQQQRPDPARGAAAP